jgi:hypothetical protein
MNLRRQNDVVATRVLLDRPADDTAQAAEAVDVGGVPESDASSGLLEERNNGVVVERPFLH